MLIGLWYTLVGALLMLVTLVGVRLKKAPLTTAMIYLVVGAGLGFWGLLHPHLFDNAHLLEVLTEAAVLVSLFVTGMNLRVPIRDARWFTPLRLAFVAMTLTVGMVAALGVYGLGLSLGAAVLLGALLAPTDPVLAADVQVQHPDDHDALRFGLTGEAGLNDGAAFPFVMLGLGLLKLHDLGERGTMWLAVDVVWAVLGGLAVGWISCTALARLVLRLRRTRSAALGHDEFLALGLIAVAYGLALLTKTYGFLAVFAAGLALRKLERDRTGDRSVEQLLLDVREKGAKGAATDRRIAPAWMLYYSRTFLNTFEHIGVFGLVLVVGALAIRTPIPAAWVWFVPAVFLVVRPLAVSLSLVGAPETAVQRGLMAWFGLRGIGSLYYLAYAIVHGFEGPEAQTVGGLALATVAASVLVHGFTVTPLMLAYDRHVARQAPSDPGEPETAEGDDPDPPEPEDITAALAFSDEDGPVPEGPVEPA